MCARGTHKKESLDYPHSRCFLFVSFFFVFCFTNAIVRLLLFPAVIWLYHRIQYEKRFLLRSCTSWNCTIYFIWHNQFVLLRKCVCVCDWKQCKSMLKLSIFFSALSTLQLHFLSAKIKICYKVALDYGQQHSSSYFFLYHDRCGNFTVNR